MIPKVISGQTSRLHMQQQSPLHNRREIAGKREGGERELILLLEHQIQSRFLIFLGYHWVISGELPVPKGDK